MHCLTIYTATFNRSKLLQRVYDSLCRQTCRDFVWLVIDDGSTDKTRELVQEWKAEALLDINYIYKENGGVHTARDLAYQLAKTELITKLDSDDWFFEDSVLKILNCWREMGGDNYIGIFAPVCFANGNLIGGHFPEIREATYQEFTYKFSFTSDKHTILRTDVINKLPKSPMFKNEKLVPESWKWIQFPLEKPFIILSSPVCVVEYQEDGYTRKSRDNWFTSPNGFREKHRQHIINCKYVKPLIKAHIGYVIFSFILKDRRFIIDSPKPLVTLLFIPFGIMGYFSTVKWSNKKSAA